MANPSVVVTELAVIGSVTSVVAVEPGFVTAALELSTY